jgi:hypothetical protein
MYIHIYICTCIGIVGSAVDIFLTVMNLPAACRSGTFHIYITIWFYIYIDICIYIFIFIYTYIYVYMNEFRYIHIIINKSFIYIYIYTYTYIGTLKSMRVVKSINNWTDIVHIVLDPVFLYPTWSAPRDLCLMRYGLYIYIYMYIYIYKCV